MSESTCQRRRYTNETYDQLVRMPITTSSFLRSFTSAKDVPKDKPTFAFIGRSNVGKSSLINGLLGRKKLAKMSATPGKTKLINYFLVNEAWYLVDLPGYGWAKTSKVHRLQWQKMIKAYLAQARITTLFLLLDSRHPLLTIDLSFLAWTVEARLPYGLILTKADQCKTREIHGHLRQLENYLHSHQWALPPCFVTTTKGSSALADNEEVIAYIEMVMRDQMGR
ncbi:MAG: ribosome biogenesis GTP-binding protein YihA/YsxC [Bacteroidota bacterium]